MSLAQWERRLRKLREHPRPWRLLASRALWHSRLSPLFHTNLDGGLRVRFFPSSISAALWVDPEARRDDVEFLQLVLRPGDTYVDGGANIGHLALVARSIVGASGRVIAIEANPRIHGYCVANLRLNGFDDVITHSLALGADVGTVTISDRRADDLNQIDSGNTVVTMRTLDEVVDSEHVTLLKLDVEGYELHVLRGAARVLGQTAFIYCELSAKHARRFGYEPAEVERLLLAHDFVFACRRGRGYDVVAREIYDSAGGGINLVAVKRSALADFTRRAQDRGLSVTVSAL